MPNHHWRSGTKTERRFTREGPTPRLWHAQRHSSCVASNDMVYLLNKLAQASIVASSNVSSHTHQLHVKASCPQSLNRVRSSSPSLLLPISLHLRFAALQAPVRVRSPGGHAPVELPSALRQHGRHLPADGGHAHAQTCESRLRLSRAPAPPPPPGLMVRIMGSMSL